MATAIWKDYFVNLGTTDGVTYTVYDAEDNTGNVIYTGKAYKRPGAANVTVNFSAIVRDYLSQRITVQISNTVFEAVPIRSKFSIYVGSTKKDDQSFYLNYSYDSPNLDMTDCTAHTPITGRVRYGMFIPFTSLKMSASNMRMECTGMAVTNTPVPSGITTSPFNFYERCSLGSGYTSGTVKIYTTNNPSIYCQYNVVTACGPNYYALYYCNKLGGIDVLWLEGKCRESEAYTRHTISVDYNNGSSYTHQRGEVNYQNDVVKSWELHTGWLTDAEAGRMSHLLGSPMVFLCVSDKFYPVILTNADCPTKVYRDGMIQYTINARLAEFIIRR